MFQDDTLYRFTYYLLAYTRIPTKDQLHERHLDFSDT